MNLLQFAAWCFGVLTGFAAGVVYMVKVDKKDGQ